MRKIKIDAAGNVTEVPFNDNQVIAIQQRQQQLQIENLHKENRMLRERIEIMEHKLNKLLND